ncbi:hypothetical protein NDU88_001586 [Pleurodeles waltl]|uniref:Uncharacterized protein n=1 Tax=Pleurodeles waltl TaxID=8319 RepID=A0AAV7Q3J8_PLEWA|nr:hypothetical protein NDU88_001586 [Pleurodeles waltl]
MRSRQLRREKKQRSDRSAPGRLQDQCGPAWEASWFSLRGGLDGGGAPRSWTQPGADGGYFILEYNIWRGPEEVQGYSPDETRVDGLVDK